MLQSPLPFLAPQRVLGSEGEIELLGDGKPAQGVAVSLTLRPLLHAVELSGPLLDVEVPPLPGLPQRYRGFVPTDTHMHVAGLERVWAAGDATWFPIKQGELAAQQAEIAAKGIAVAAGARVPAASFRPVLRAALVTGGVPRLLESAPEATRGSWWPPAKAVGRYLGPYLAGERRAKARSDGGEVPGTLAGTLHSEAEQREAVEFALAAADSDARLGRLPEALAWLDLVEEMNLVIPPEYAERRERWEREAQHR